MKSILFRVLLVVGLLCCFGAAGFAQGSTYIFPGITINDNITVGNLNQTVTTASIGFYDSSGKLNPLTVELLPGTQTRVNPSSVALSSFTGSVVITAPLPLTVSADRFEGNTAFDFIYPSPVAATLLIPFLPAGAATDVNVFNPGPNQAEVKVVLMQSNGAHTDSRTATVDALHTATISIPSSSAVAYAFVVTANILRPDSPVAANAVIRTWNPQTSGAVARTDFAVVNAVPVTNAVTSTVPFFAQGPDYFSKVHVANLSTSEQTISVTATRADGTLVPGTNNPAFVVLPPYGSTDQEMVALFGSTATSLYSGTITAASVGSATYTGPVDGPKVPLTASVSVGNLSEPSLAVIPPDLPAQTVFAFQLRGTGREFFTGLTFQNPGTSDAHAMLSFVLDGGATISSIPYTIAKGQQQIVALSDLFPEAVGNGFIYVKSDVPIIALGLDGRSDNTALALRLPLYANASYTPPPLTTYVVTGTVRDANTGVNGSNIGVPDVAFGLAGPINLTTATDAAGTFTFYGLPPGRYQLTPLPVGYTVSPGGSTIVITNQNSRNNDFQIGLTTPTITQMNPASALTTTAGSNAGGVQISVQGTNFTPPITFSGNIFTGNINKFTTGTVLVFAASQTPTTVTNPTFLQASVPASLLVTTGTVPVTIRNLGPSGDFVDSAPVSFLVGSAAPTLTNVTGQPTPLILGEVTKPFNITVNGSGFTPATQVRVNFVGRATTYVNQNQVTSTVFPSDLTIAGFVPITVQNPNSVDSTPFQLPLLYPIPVISNVSPSSLVAPVALNAPPVLVTINGSNFAQNPNNLLDFATVLVNGSPVPTQYVSSTQVVGVIPASIAATPGLLQIAVTNPQPNLAPSNAATLSVVNPVAVITGLDAGNVSFNPNTAPNTFFNQAVVVSGNNFAPGAVVWYNPPCDTLGYRKALTTVRNSSTQIVATIPIRCAGTYGIEVQNPQPGGGLSAPVSLNVPSSSGSTVDTVVSTGSPAPVITAVSGNVSYDVTAASNGGNPQTVVITGGNFTSDSVVLVNVPCDDLGYRVALSTVVNSPTQLSATIPVSCAGTYGIEVQTAAGASAPAALVVSSATTLTNQMRRPTAPVGFGVE